MATSIVYALAEEARSGGPRPLDEAEAESALLEQVFAVQQQQGRLDSFEIRADSWYALTVRSAPVPGWHVEARVNLRGEARETHQLVFVVGDQILKIRASFAPGAVAMDELTRFAERFLERALGSATG